GEQSRARPAALDRKPGQRRLHDRFAGPATQLRPHNLHNLEGGWDVFEQFGYVLAERTQDGAAATGAGRRRLMHDPLARQVRRQRLAPTRLAIAWLDAFRRRGLFLLALLGTGVALRHAFFELPEQKLE